MFCSVGFRCIYRAAIFRRSSSVRTLLYYLAVWSNNIQILLYNSLYSPAKFRHCFVISLPSLAVSNIALQFPGLSRQFSDMTMKFRYVVKQCSDMITL